jgi:hypothetical protein
MQAKQLARDYRALTGKPLGITGEVAEFEAWGRSRSPTQEPSVAGLANGNFIALWTISAVHSTGPSANQVYGQIFTADPTSPSPLPKLAGSAFLQRPVLPHIDKPAGQRAAAGKRVPRIVWPPNQQQSPVAQ